MVHVIQIVVQIVDQFLLFELSARVVFGRVHGLEDRLCGIGQRYHLAALDDSQRNFVVVLFSIFVADGLIEGLLLHQRGHNQVVGRTRAGNLRWRADEVVAYILQVIGHLGTHHVATVGKDELHVLLRLEYLGHRGYVQPHIAGALVRPVGIGTAICPASRLIAVQAVAPEEPSCAVSPKHKTIVLGRIVGESLLYYRLEGGRVAGYHCRVERNGVPELTFPEMQQIG